MAIVNARGTIAAGSVGAFDREISRALEAGATKLLVDLGDADDVTTAGMNVLLAARQRLRGRDGQIAVVLSRLLRGASKHFSSTGASSSPPTDSRPRGCSVSPAAARHTPD